MRVIDETRGAVNEPQPHCGLDGDHENPQAEPPREWHADRRALKPSQDDRSRPDRGGDRGGDERAEPAELGTPAQPQGQNRGAANSPAAVGDREGTRR